MNVRTFINKLRYLTCSAALPGEDDEQPQLFSFTLRLK